MSPTKRRPRHSRHGTATVELAVCLPMLALLVFGSIQASNLIYLKHALTSAAYEGTLELARADATPDSVELRVEQVLSMHDIDKATVDISPSGGTFNNLSAGSPVSIRVSADVAPNLSLINWFPCPDTLEYTAVGPK